MKFLLGSLFLSSVSLVCAADVAKPPKLPPPFHSPSASNGPKVIPQPDGVQLKLPAGFTVQEFASGFQRPRYLAAGPSGEVLVSDSVAKAGTVYVLSDKDKDGKAEDKKELISGLDRPYGLALHGDYLYIAEPESIKRYKYDAKAMTIGAGEEVVALKDTGKGHWTRTILMDPKAGKFYLGVGSQADIAPDVPEIRAAISRYNLDGSGREIIATGVRNPVGLSLNPTTRMLWASVQERDNIGDDLVPDFFTSIQPGGFYGWPYSYIGPNEDPRNKGLKPELVAKTIVPDVVLPSHVAVMDARFYTGKGFPKRYQNGAFLAYHGSSNRAKRIGYSVMFIPFKNGKPAGEPEEFLSGFMLGPDQTEVWGRPVGLLELADGSLLVSDDGGKRIWKISYRK